MGRERRFLKNQYCVAILVSLLMCWCPPWTAYSSQHQRRATFNSGGKSVSYEIFGEREGAPVLIVLHGASGPDVPLYRDQAQLFANKGYKVLLLHYFDATGSTNPTTQNYYTWAKTVGDLVEHCRRESGVPTLKIGLLGFSLGSSVALAAGSQLVPVQAIADWYGSLPDEFFYHFQGMPPLMILHGAKDNIIPVLNAQQLVKLCDIKQLTCESHIYPDQGHGFEGKALEDADKRTLEFFSGILD